MKKLMLFFLLPMLPIVIMVIYILKYLKKHPEWKEYIQLITQKMAEVMEQVNESVIKTKFKQSE